MQQRRNPLAVVLVCSLLSVVTMISSRSALAQSTIATGSIQGVVKDSSGGVVPGAKVSVVSVGVYAGWKSGGVPDHRERRREYLGAAARSGSRASVDAFHIGPDSIFQMVAGREDAGRG